MKLTSALVISSALLPAHAAHHCNEYTSNISGPRKSWMNGGRTDQETEQEPDLLHRHDMHSYTGAEGIDHHVEERDGDECKRPRAHKKMIQASSDLIHRHDMHSFLGAEGIDHHTESNTLDKPTETHVVKHTRRRLDRSRTSNSGKSMNYSSNKATKTVQVDVPAGEGLSSTIYFNHDY